MHPTSGDRRRELRRRHWWWRARDMVVVRELERSAPPGGWARALELGSADGGRLPALPRFAASVDAHPLDERFDPGRRYDLVLLLDVLQRAEDPDAVVARAADLLEPGGLAVVTVPAWEHLRTGRDGREGVRTRWDRPALEALLGTALEVERSRYFFQWLHKATLARRAWEAVGGSDPAPAAIPPAPWNALLYALSVVDELAFGGLPLPWGSSLVAVARKR